MLLQATVGWAAVLSDYKYSVVYKCEGSKTIADNIYVIDDILLSYIVEIYSGKISILSKYYFWCK